MKYLKEYGLLLGKFLLFLLGGSLLTSVFYYYLMSQEIVMLFSVIYVGLMCFFFSYSSGKKVAQKGFLEGLKIGTLFSFILFLISMLLSRFQITCLQFIYYFILTVISIVGATIGINKKNIK